MGVIGVEEEVIGDQVLLGQVAVDPEGTVFPDRVSGEVVPVGGDQHQAVLAVPDDRVLLHDIVMADIREDDP